MSGEVDSRIVGQDRVVRQLIHAVQSDRLAHGLLFLGADGIGREHTARHLAAGRLCDNRGPHATPAAAAFGCGACDACRRVLSGVHPDVHVLACEAELVERGLATPPSGKQPSRDIKVAAVRELSGRLRKKAFGGGARVAIVVGAHRLNTQAANALLKTLEEPPEGTHLILLAPGERAVLPTIASRCQRLLFSPLSDAALTTLLEQQGADVTAERLQLAQGSLTRALDAEDETQALVEWLERIDGASRARRVDIIDALGKDRASVRAVLSGCSTVLMQSVRARLSHAETRVLPERPIRVLHQVLEALTDAVRALDRHANVQLTVENLLYERWPGPARR